MTDQEWAELLQRVSIVETKISQLCDNDIPHINIELQWIRERLNRGYRPPWSVAILVAFLSSMCVGLLVTLVRR